MQIQTAKLKSCLTGKCKFVSLNKKKHDGYEMRTDDGKVIVYTQVSRSWSFVSQPMLSEIARQLRLSAKELSELVGCTLSLDQYKEILREKGETG